MHFAQDGPSIQFHKRSQLFYANQAASRRDHLKSIKYGKISRIRCQYRSNASDLVRGG